MERSSVTASTGGKAGEGILTTTVTLERRERYEFVVRADGLAPFLVDEPPPLGEGHGPGPDTLLGSAIGSCLGSSLLFCAGKAHVPLDRLSVRVSVEKTRNERGRLRIGSIKVELAVDVALEHRERFERCRGLFEDYCVVTESVRNGIPVDVAVRNTGP